MPGAKPLVEAVTAEAAPVEAVLLGGEFLAWRGAWKELDRIRKPLSALATVRALELAALAALRSGDPAACLEVLEAGAASIESAVLPRPLIHLRMAANEALGRHEPLLADLLALRRDGDDASTRDRIMDAYVRIGDLDRLRVEVDKALDRSTLDPRRALGMAYVLRASAPATARRALLLATQDAVSPIAAGAVLSLAAELNVPDVRESMMRIVLADPTANRVTKFERVEDVIAFMERSATEHRERFGEWRKGRVPFALTTAWDIETFGRMFVAEPGYRRDRLRDTFPMLLMSGTKRTPVPPPPEGTVLRPDLGALLLAHRLRLLDLLDSAFTVQIPLSTAESLTDLEAKFSRPSPEILACAEDLFGKRSAVRVVAELPAGAVSIESEEAPMELDEAVVRDLLARAFVTGHLDRNAVERARASLGVPVLEERMPAIEVRMTRVAFARLAGAGILEQVARGTPCYMSTEEVDVLRSEVAGAIEDGRIRDAVEDLRRTLAQRLSSGIWTTAAGRPQAAGDGREPPHVRCIVEAVGAHGDDAGWLWIEDRALSHGRMDGAVQLPDVLKELERRAILGPAELASRLRELRRIGYAYLPLDVDAFHFAIRAAPSSEHGLIETPELAELRTWMAREVQLLADIEIREQYDEEGRVAGEARRVLDVWGLARDLLVRIWEEPGLDVAERRSRSAWIWTNLRVDRVSGLPADASVETRRTFRALGLTYLLDAPLLATLDQTRVSSTPWKVFVEWVMATCGQPLFENDLKAREIVLATLGRQLGDLLARHTVGPEELRPHVEAAASRCVRDFLDLLPEEFADALKDDERVGAGLGTRNAMVLTVGSDEEEDGVQGAAPLADFVAAYGRIDGASGGQQAVRLLDGREAFVEVEPGERAPRVSLLVDDKRTMVDPIMAALLSPAERRRIPDALRDGLCVPTGTITSEALDVVEATEDADARFAALQALFDGDLDRTLRVTGGRARSLGNVRLSDFGLPKPEAVMTYFGLRPETQPDELMATASAGLAALPAEEAWRRLASIPLPHPSGSLTSTDALRPTEERSRLSPMLAGFEFIGLATSGATGGDLDPAVATFLSSMENQAALLVAVVRYLAAAATRDEAWRGLDPAVRLPLLWACADQLVQHLAPPGHDFRDVARWLDDFTSFPFLDRVGESGMPTWYTRATVEMTEARLKGLLIGRIVEAISERLSENAIVALQGACGTSANQNWSPNAALLAPRPAGPEGSWICGDPLSENRLGRWLPSGSPFGRRSDEDFATSLLEEDLGAEATHLLVPLLSCVDPRHVSPATAERMRDAAEAAGNAGAFEPNMVATRNILSVEAGLRALAGDEAGMRTVLSDGARRCADRWPGIAVKSKDGRDDLYSALTILIEASIEFALKLDRPMPERFGAFADGVRAVVDAWPASRAAALARLDAAVRLGGSEEADALWPVILELRSRA